MRVWKGFKNAMERVLTFDNSKQAPRRYRMLRQGFLAGSDQGRRSIDVIRREAKILDKLDAIGLVKSDLAAAAGVEPVPELNGAQELVLEQAEYDLLKRYVENTPWLPGAAREVVDLVDWLTTATTREKTPERAPAGRRGVKGET